MVKFKSTEEFIYAAKKIHGNKFSYEKSQYNGINTKLIIYCSLHGEFKTTPQIHLNGSTCKKCFQEFTNKSSLQDFLDKAYKIHGNKFSYDKVIYHNSKNKIIIICNKHGEFLQTPDNHLTGRGCKKCAIETAPQHQAKSKEVFLYQVRKIHENKYNYDKINYINAHTNIEISCQIHGIFKQSPSNHLAGKGCYKCGKNAMKEKRFSNTQEFIFKAQKIWQDKYIYDKVIYTQAIKNIIIICRNHGDFLSTPNKHLSGTGCPKCVKNFSHIEEKWLDSMKIPQNMRRKRLIINKKVYFPDGFDPETNTIYEFYGDFWHGNPKIYKFDDYNTAVNKTFGELYNKTIKREKRLLKAGYKIISIWEKDFIEQLKIISKSS